MMDGLKILGATLTPAACGDVIATAAEAGTTYGIGYWAEVVAYDERSLTLEDVEGAGSISGVDGYPGKLSPRIVLTADQISMAVSAMLMDPKATASEGWTGRFFDRDGVDGPLADAIVQVACFGKVIYG